MILCAKKTVANVPLPKIKSLDFDVFFITKFSSLKFSF